VIHKTLFFFIIFTLFLATPGFGEEKEAITSSEILKTSSSWDGAALPRYPKGRPEITVLRITVQPGAEFPVHKHPVINAAVLLSGELTVSTTHGQSIHLKAGDAMAEVVHTWHYGKNEGKVPAEIVVFYAGTLGSPITLKAK